MSAFDMNTQLSELLNHPVGRNLLCQHMPQVVKNPQLAGMSLQGLLNILPPEAGQLLTALPGMCNAYQGHERACSRDYYEVTQAFDGVYRLFSPEDVRMELIVGREKALLLDTGYGYGDIQAAVRKVTDRPLIVVNSHGHVDHTCGNFQFGDPIYIHPDDMTLCEAHNTRTMREKNIALAHHGYDYYSGETYCTLPSDFEEERYLNAGFGHLIPVEEGQVFDLGGVRLEVVTLPGHTRGSIGLLDRDRKLFFVGDALNSYLWLFAPEAMTLSDYKRTLAKAEDIDFDWMFQAHNGEKQPKEALAWYRDAAETLDFEKGQPFQSPLVPDADARVCIRAGMTLQNFRDPGFAAIVISKDHLN